MPFLVGNEFHFYLEKTRQSCQQNYAYNFIKYSGLPAKDRHLPRGGAGIFSAPDALFPVPRTDGVDTKGRREGHSWGRRLAGREARRGRTPAARRRGGRDGRTPLRAVPHAGCAPAPAPRAAGSLSPGRGGPRQAVIRPPAGVVLPGAACRSLPVPTAGDPARAGRWPRPHGRERWRPCRPGPRWCGPGAAPGCRHGRKGPGRARPVP